MSGRPSAWSGSRRRPEKFWAGSISQGLLEPHERRRHRRLERDCLRREGRPAVRDGEVVAEALRDQDCAKVGPQLKSAALCQGVLLRFLDAYILPSFVIMSSADVFGWHRLVDAENLAVLADVEGPALGEAAGVARRRQSPSPSSDRSAAGSPPFPSQRMPLLSSASSTLAMK